MSQGAASVPNTVYVSHHRKLSTSFAPLKRMLMKVVISLAEMNPIGLSANTILLPRPTRTGASAGSKTRMSGTQSNKRRFKSKTD